MSLRKPSGFRLSSPTEQAVADALRNMGYNIYRNGWPDFLVHRPLRSGQYDGSVFAVEVKRKGDRLSESQEAMHAILNRLGLPIYISYADDFEALIRVGGRALLSEEARAGMEARIRRLEEQIASLQREMALVETELHASTVFLKEPTINRAERPLVLSPGA